MWREFQRLKFVENHFRLFGIQPSPWVDLDQLKHIFLERSTQSHPDKSPQNGTAAERQFQQLNDAYNQLRNTRSRILHFLELSGVKQESVQTVPDVVLKFFTRVAALTNQADALNKQKLSATSPMLKVALMDDTLMQIEAMQNLQLELSDAVNRVEERVHSIAKDMHDRVAAADVLELSELATALGYLQRWQAELQERIGALTF